MTDDVPHDGDGTPRGRSESEGQGGADGEGATCDRCSGDAVTARSGTVPVLECADCGNVLGLADAALDAGAGPEEPVSTDEVTATDGELGQLVTLLRAEGTGGGSGRSITADRLLLSTEAATLEVRASDGDVEIRVLDRDDD